MAVNIFEEKLARDSVRLTAAADVSQFDLVVIAPYVAIAQEDVDSGGVGNFDVRAELEVQSDDLHATENTFDTLLSTVYYDPITATLSDTSTAGYYPVGYLTSVKDSNGVIKFEKFRFTEVVA
jgi:hypothetical protein